MHYILIPGTWGSEALWWRKRSLFRNYLLSLGHSTDIFEWSTGLDGVVGDNNIWYEAGLRLADRILCKYSREVGLIAHSHGCQVGYYALGRNTPIRVRSYITVDGPVRREMADLRLGTRTRCHKWIHIHGSGTVWQWLGSWFDGSVIYSQEAPEAHENVLVKGASHGEGKGGLLTVDVWKDNNLGQYLKV